MVQDSTVSLRDRVCILLRPNLNYLMVYRLLLPSLVGEVLNPSILMPGAVPGSDGMSWQKDPSDSEGFNSLGAHPCSVIPNS